MLVIQVDDVAQATGTIEKTEKNTHCQDRIIFACIRLSRRSETFQNSPTLDLSHLDYLKSC